MFQGFKWPFYGLLLLIAVWFETPVEHNVSQAIIGFYPEGDRMCWNTDPQKLK